MALHWSVFEQGLTFEYPYQGHLLPVSEWQNIASGHTYAQWLLLQELIENGQAESNEQSVLIPHEEVCLLSEIDQHLLELPQPFKGVIRIDADGELGRPGFQFNWGLYEHIHGQKLNSQVTGCIITSSEGYQALLDFAQLKLCQILKEHSVQDNRSPHQDWLYFAKIKELAPQAGAHLDRYLASEQVILPEQLQLKLELNGETLEVLPEISFESSPQFEQRFDRFPRVQSSYTLTEEDGSRLRVVFSENQQEELNKAKSVRRITGEQKQKLLEHPETFFDPDVINLDRFSARVLEIGLYKPKFYPFISPYKSQWIPGFLVETSAEERTKVVFESPDKLDKFHAEIISAKEAGQSSVTWEGFQLPLNEAVSLHEIAQKQWAEPGEPLDAKMSREKKVLIIKENVEAVEHFEEASESQSQYEFIHRFSSPPDLKRHIRIMPHQQEGIAWLQTLYEDGFSGALLADDMGLGKTLQGLSFINWHHRTQNDGHTPYLIVAPVSLLENWEAEYQKFFNNADLPIFQAYSEALSKALNVGWNMSVANLQQQHIVLTTYETLRRNQLVFCAVDWAIVILDESQKIKNPGTLVTNAAKALKAVFKLAATGTPVENTLLDLWCIMDFAVPGLLGSAREFAAVYQTPLKSDETDLVSLGNQLRQQVGIHIKRRLKQDILDELPRKLIRREQKEMPEKQLEAYLLALKGKDNLTDKKQVLQILHQIRDISAHPFLLSEGFDELPIEELIATSAKLEITCEIISHILQKNEKVILFSERRETQRMLARVLRETFGINSSIINGDTPAHKQSQNSVKLSRQQAVDRFQAVPGFNAIIMSQLAAGVGLNITKANHVIHFSRHWNPAKEDQATDRAYRIGQEKDVYVYLPQAVHSEFKTFDLILDELLEKKRQLANASLFPTEKAEINPDEFFQKIMQ